MQLKGLKVNFLGDSITEGVGTSAPEHIYLNVLQRSCAFSLVRNYGISGTRIARQKWCRAADQNEDNNFCARVAQMDPDADLVLVFGGTNDFGHGDAPLGLPSDRTRDTFYGACHEMMRSLLEKYPYATIVILTPLHRENELSPYGDNRENQAAVLGDYVEILRQVAGYYGLPVCDLYRISGIQPAIAAQKEMYMPDGLHPSDAGNARIAARIQAFLQAL